MHRFTLILEILQNMQYTDTISVNLAKNERQETL